MTSFIFESPFMSDSPLSEIDFKMILDALWTTLKNDLVAGEKNVGFFIYQEDKLMLAIRPKTENYKLSKSGKIMIIG